MLAVCLALSACGDNFTEGATVNEEGFDDPYDTYLDRSWDACGAPGKNGDRDVINLDQLTGQTRGRVIRSWQTTVSFLTVPNPFTCEPMSQTPSLLQPGDVDAFDSAAFTLDSVGLRYDLYFYNPTQLADSDIETIAENIAAQIGNQVGDDHQVQATTSLDTIVVVKTHPQDDNTDRADIIDAYGQVNRAFG